MEVLVALINEFGLTVALTVVITVFVMQQINRGTKVIARDYHSHLDDTETIREFAKQDRELMANIQNRYEMMADKNLEMTRKLGEYEKELAVLREKSDNDLQDCNEKYTRQQAEIDKLKLDIAQLRSDIAEKDETILAQQAIIKQLKAS